jgi:2,3-bisphosphoglycerate-independent phosphoglycerate mutase
MFLENGEPNFSATANPVPFHIVNEDLNGTNLRENGSLEDIVPTMLAILGLEQPEEMTGKDLRT